MAGITSDPTSQLGRFVVTNRPTASPGSCVVCGYTGDQRQYLDFRLDFEFYGSVYLCSDCMVDAGNCLGFATPEKFDAALATIKEQNEIIEELRTALTLSEQTVDVLSQRRLSDRALANASKPVVDNHELKTEQPTDYRHLKKPVARVPEPEPEPVEQIDGEGSDDTGDATVDFFSI